MKKNIINLKKLVLDERIKLEKSISEYSDFMVVAKMIAMAQVIENFTEGIKGMSDLKMQVEIDKLIQSMQLVFGSIIIEIKDIEITGD